MSLPSLSTLHSLCTIIMNIGTHCFFTESKNPTAQKQALLTLFIYADRQSMLMLFACFRPLSFYPFPIQMPFYTLYCACLYYLLQRLMWDNRHLLCEKCNPQISFKFLLSSLHPLVLGKRFIYSISALNNFINMQGHPQSTSFPCVATFRELWTHPKAPLYISAFKVSTIYCIDYRSCLLGS